MKPHPLWPQLVLLSLSVFSLLGLSPVASALALPPPTARHDQKSLQAISHDVHDTHGVNTASGIKTLPDNLITAPTVIKPGHMDIPVAVSPHATISAPSTGCTSTTSKLTKSILQSLVPKVKATKNFPSTLLNFITATHPERHPHLARRAGAKRDLNQEDPKLSEAVDYAGKIFVNTGKAIMWLIGAWAESKCLFCSDSGPMWPEKRDLDTEDGHGKRDLNEMNDVETEDDPKLIEAVDYAGKILKEGWEFVLHLAALLVESLHFF